MARPKSLRKYQDPCDDLQAEPHHRRLGNFRTPGEGVCGPPSRLRLTFPPGDTHCYRRTRTSSTGPSAPDARGRRSCRGPRSLPSQRGATPTPSGVTRSHSSHDDFPTPAVHLKALNRRTVVLSATGNRRRTLDELPWMPCPKNCPQTRAQRTFPLAKPTIRAPKSRGIRQMQPPSRDWPTGRRE